MNTPTTTPKRSRFSFLKKIKPWHVLVSTLTLGALLLLFLLIFKLGHRSSAVVADTQNAEASLLDSGRESSVTRSRSPKPRGITDPPPGSGGSSTQSLGTSAEEKEGENTTKKDITKTTAEKLNRTTDAAVTKDEIQGQSEIDRVSKDEMQARAEIDDFRVNWEKAAKGDFSKVDPEVKAVIENGEKSADMILEEKAKNELKQTLNNSESSLAQVQIALDNYHAVVKHLSVEESEIAAIGDPTKAENLCEFRLRELCRKVKNGTPVTQEIINEAISLLRSPGELTSLGLAGRLNIVDNIKQTPQETLERFFDADLAHFNEYYESNNASIIYTLLTISNYRTHSNFSGFSCLWAAFKKDSRIEDMQEILNSSVAADPKVVQTFIKACSNLEHVVPPHFLLEEVCQQLDSEPEILSRFIERYIIYGFNLKDKTFGTFHSDLKSYDRRLVSQAIQKNKKRMVQAMKLRDAIYLKMNPLINDKKITESSEWKKFMDSPKDRSVFINLLKKLESLGLKAAAMKKISKDMMLQTQITAISTTTPEYNNVRAIDALCDLFSREVPSEERKYFDIMKKHYFDMKNGEALDAFYQLLRLNRSNFFSLWKKVGISFGYREELLQTHDIFNLISLVKSVSFEQEGALSTLVLVATLEEIINQSPELSVLFRNLPDKLLEALKETNVPQQILRDFHATITGNSKDEISKVSSFYEKIIQYANPNSFLALDYNVHNENISISKKWGGKILNRKNLLVIARAEVDSRFIMYFSEANLEYTGLFRSAALAQKAYEDKNFSMGLPTYIQRIDIGDVDFVEAVENQILLPLDIERGIFKQTNPSPYFIAKKQFQEGARDDIYTNPASSLDTVEKLFKYMVEDPFMKQLDACGTLNKVYNVNINACGLSLLDTKLTGSVLENAGIADYDSMVAYMHFMALKHAKAILSDNNIRGKLIGLFIDGKHGIFRSEFDKHLPLKNALNAFMQQANMGNESKMSPQECAVHAQIYKPLQDNPEAYYKQLEDDLGIAEENLKRIFKFLMEKLALKFLFPPTLQFGSIYESGIETGWDLW